jgi:hypothetical protein
MEQALASAPADPYPLLVMMSLEPDCNLTAVTKKGSF